MNTNQNQLRQASGSTRSTSLTRATGHPYAPVHQIHTVNPLHTLRVPSKARTRPYLYSSRSFHIHVPLPSPNLSSSISTPSRTTAIPSAVLSTRTPSTLHPPLQPLSTHPFPAQPSSIALPRDDTRAVPSKRALEYTPGPLPLYRASPIHPSSDRPAKRSRLDIRVPRTVPNCRGPQPLVFAKLPPPIQPSNLGTNLSRPTPKQKEAPLRPPAVDYGCPIQPVVPQPPFCRPSLRQNRVPLPPYPKTLEELKGPVDPATAGELGDLMWMQQKRVWDDRGGYSDPFVSRPIPISLLDDRSLSSGEGGTPAKSQPKMIALYGPPPRYSESTHLGKRLTNPNTIEVDNNRDAGFEEVLDPYRGAVQGSTLSMELEVAVGGDAGLGVRWEVASSLEVSIGSGYGEPREPRISTLAEYRQAVEAEKVVSLSEPAILKDEPTLGIEWSYHSCGYTTRRVIDSQKACKQSRQQSAPSTPADPPHRH